MRSCIICHLLINCLLLKNVQGEEELESEGYLCLGFEYYTELWKVIDPCPNGKVLYKILKGLFPTYKNASNSCLQNEMFLISIASEYDVQFLGHDIRSEIDKDAHILLGLRFVNGKLEFEDGASTEYILKQYNMSHTDWGPDSCFTFASENDKNKIFPQPCNEKQTSIVCKGFPGDEDANEAINYRQAVTVATLSLFINLIFIVMGCTYGGVYIYRRKKENKRELLQRTAKKTVDEKKYRKPKKQSNEAVNKTEEENITVENHHMMETPQKSGKQHHDVTVKKDISDDEPFPPPPPYLLS